MQWTSGDMEDPLQHSQDEDFVQHPLCLHHFFMYKMQKSNNLLDDVNKVKALADQLACLEVHVREVDIVMTLFDNLPATYEYFMTAFAKMSIKKPMTDYMMAYLMHKMSKRKVKEPKMKISP